jgi:hypothetical protein
MCPIPGNIIGLRVPDIAWYRWRNIDQGFAVRWPVEEIAYCGPDSAGVVSVVMSERSGD